jgi:hypothetical protein
MTNYNDGKWHGHNGGECPVHPETVVHWVNTEGQSHKTVAGTLCWNDELAPVAAFRVINEHKDPRERFILRNKKDGREFLFKSAEDAKKYGCFADQKTEIIHVREVLK